MSVIRDRLLSFEQWIDKINSLLKEKLNKSRDELMDFDYYILFEKECNFDDVIKIVYNQNYDVWREEIQKIIFDNMKSFIEDIEFIENFSLYDIFINGNCEKYSDVAKNIIEKYKQSLFVNWMKEINKHMNYLKINYNNLNFSWFLYRNLNFVYYFKNNWTSLQVFTLYCDTNNKLEEVQKKISETNVKSITLTCYNNYWNNIDIRSSEEIFEDFMFENWMIEVNSMVFQKIKQYLKDLTDQDYRLRYDDNKFTSQQMADNIINEWYTEMNFCKNQIVM